jgi:CheY-like chemotaxis protein
MNALHTRILERAIELNGSVAALALRLGVAAETVLLWKQERATIPADIVEKLLDVLLDAEVAALAKRVPEAAPRRARILIVDDEPASAYTLARIVKQLGHDAETVTDSADALPTARRLRPDVVFIDLRMPGADGVEIARALKAEGLGSHIVAATAYPLELQRERTTAAGFAGHLVKPVDRGSVEKLLLTALA